MTDRYYEKCKLLGEKDDYIYIEFNRKKCSSYGKYVYSVGKDLVTGTRVVYDGYYSTIDEAVRRDPTRAGNLHLYVKPGIYLQKSEVIAELNKMSKEDIKRYVKSIKDVKEKYKNVKKKNKQEHKAAVMKYRGENSELRSIQRKVKQKAKRMEKKNGISI